MTTLLRLPRPTILNEYHHIHSARLYGFGVESDFDFTDILIAVSAFTSQLLRLQITSEEVFTKYYKLYLSQSIATSRMLKKCIKDSIHVSLGV